MMKKSAPSLYEVLRQTLPHLAAKPPVESPPPASEQVPPQAVSAEALRPPPQTAGSDWERPVDGLELSPAVQEPVSQGGTEREIVEESTPPPDSPSELAEQPVAQRTVSGATHWPQESPGHEREVTEGGDTVADEPAQAHWPARPRMGILERASALGERRLVVTYNNAMFGALLLLTAFFAVYVAGHQRGRSAAGWADDAVGSVEGATSETDPAIHSGDHAVESRAAEHGQPLLRVQVAYFNLSGRRTAEVLARRLAAEGFPDVELEEFVLRGQRMVRVVFGWFASETDPAAVAWRQRAQALYSQASLVRVSR